MTATSYRSQARPSHPTRPWPGFPNSNSCIQPPNGFPSTLSSPLLRLPRGSRGAGLLSDGDGRVLHRADAPLRGLHSSGPRAELSGKQVDLAWVLPIRFLVPFLARLHFSVSCDNTLRTVACFCIKIHHQLLSPKPNALGGASIPNFELRIAVPPEIIQLTLASRRVEVLAEEEKPFELRPWAGLRGQWPGPRIPLLAN